MRTTSGSAERLQRSAGAWKLEFQQLVYNTPSLLRPRRFAVQGEQAILQQLREFPGHEPLAKDAERLFARGALPDGTYMVRDGRWFPELRPEPMAEAAASGAAQPTAAAIAGGRSALSELTKRVASLEASVRGLQEQIEQALLALAQGAAAQHAAPQRATNPPRVSVEPSEPSHATHEPASHSPPPAAARPGARSLRSSAIPLAATQSPSLSPHEAPELAKPIALPVTSVLSDLVKSLAGPDALLSAADQIRWEHVVTQQPVFYAPVHNHDGVEAGGMLFDLEGALRLAGALLMESEEVVDALLEEKVMSDEMLDAASEVCNTLTSSFNKVSGNPHVRAGKMEPVQADGIAEVASARKRDDYRYNRGGLLSMIAR